MSKQFGPRINGAFFLDRRLDRVFRGSKSKNHHGSCVLGQPPAEAGIGGSQANDENRPGADGQTARHIVFYATESSLSVLMTTDRDSPNPPFQVFHAGGEAPCTARIAQNSARAFYICDFLGHARDVIHDPVTQRSYFRSGCFRRLN